MSDAYSWIKIIHIVSATILFGTGLGTAFHMWMTHLGGDPRAIAAVSRNVVLADLVFTTPAVIVQPVSGLALIFLSGISLSSPWLVGALVLYVVAGICWLRVVWLQLAVRDMAHLAVAENQPLPAEYYRHMRLWFALGWPAFGAVVAIFWLMVRKPDLW